MNMVLLGKPLFRLVGAVLVALALAILFGAQQVPSPVSAQTPTPATLVGLNGTATGATTATVTIFLNNPDSVSTTVYFRYGRGGTYQPVVSLTTSSTQVQHNLTGLNAGTSYSIQVALTLNDPFVPESTATVTAGTPSILDRSRQRGGPQQRQDNGHRRIPQQQHRQSAIQENRRPRSG